MIYSPYSLLPHIKEGRIIRELSDREIFNPEGVGFDLRIKSVSEILHGSGSLRASTRRTPSHKLITVNDDNCWLILPSKTYLVSTFEEFELPSDLAATFFPRSTLFRSGIAFNSSILPPGYIGPMTFALTNHYTEPFEIEIGARFAHVVFHSVCGDVGFYKGQWQGGRVTQPSNEEQI